MAGQLYKTMMDLATSESLPSQAQGSLSSDELRVHLSVPSDNVVINNTHSYSSRYQRIHTFPDEREHDREGEGEYQEPSALLRPRDYRDSTGMLQNATSRHIFMDMIDCLKLLL